MVAGRPQSPLPTTEASSPEGRRLWGKNLHGIPLHILDEGGLEGAGAELRGRSRHVPSHSAGRGATLCPLNLAGRRPKLYHGELGSEPWPCFLKCERISGAESSTASWAAAPSPARDGARGLGSLAPGSARAVGILMRSSPALSLTATCCYLGSCRHKLFLSFLQVPVISHR